MEDNYDNATARVGGIATEHAAAVLVFASLLFLILVRRGFTGVSVGGVGVSVR